MAAPKPKRIEDVRKRDDLIVVTGAGGFIAGSLVRYFHDKGFTRIRAVDKKPLEEWYRRTPGVEDLVLDVSFRDNCVKACDGAVEVYNLAADMGGMGFIERYRVECLRSVLINTHMIEAAQKAGADRYFFSSSACAYNIDLQKDTQSAGPQGVRRLSGQRRARLRLGEALLGDRLPGVLGRARPQDGHRPVPQRLRPLRDLGRRPREGPGGPLRARSSRPRTTAAAPIEIWGDGTRTRSFMWIERLPQRHRHDHALRRARRDAHQPGLERARLDQRAPRHRRGDRRVQGRAPLRPHGAPGGRRAELRQHDDPAGPGLGAVDAAARRGWPRPTPGSPSSTRRERPGRRSSSRASAPRASAGRGALPGRAPGHRRRRTRRSTRRGTSSCKLPSVMRPRKKRTGAARHRPPG